MESQDLVRRLPGVLRAGTAAPDFELYATPDQSLRLSELRPRPIILAFYPADWSPVCGDELALLDENLPAFRNLGATVIGISVDGVWCHCAFARELGLHFPLLSDFEPKGAVSRLYGAYRDDDGCSARALFVIDGEGVIRWSYCSPIGLNPGAEGILEALATMRRRPRETGTKAAPPALAGARP
jgi:peroxiredoxin